MVGNEGIDFKQQTELFLIANFHVFYH